MTGRTARRRVVRISLPGGAEARADFLAAEEPLGIRIGGEAFTLTMRTPGDDIDLAAGFLVSEGVIRSAADLAGIRICPTETCDHGDHDGIGNIADVTLSPDAMAVPRHRRNFLTTSACGVCGKASIDELAIRSSLIWPPTRRQWRRKCWRSCRRLPRRPAGVRPTGGLHAAGLFSPMELLAVREDVGRHNAVDKVVGWALR